MRVTAFVAVALAVLIQPAPQAQPALRGASRAGEILVKFQPGAAASAQADAHRQAGGTAVAEVARTRVQRVVVPAGSEAAALARYARNPNVLYAEPNYVRRIPSLASHDPASAAVPGDFYFPEQWALHNTGQGTVCIPLLDGVFCLYTTTADADIDAPEAWALSKGSPATIVAIIDSGLDYTHPDLAANYLGGYNYIDGNTDPMDEHGHGTHVAGTIAAAIDNPTGSPAASEGVVGVAPNVRLLSYKVCRLDGTCDDFAIQQAIGQAIVDGASVINMSLGETGRSESLNEAVQDAWQAGLVIVAGAGNDGNEVLFYPAAFDNVVSVGAFDEDHRRASFSNFGTWVDLSAPGNVIMSSYPMAACAGAVPVPGDTGCYNWLSGTSMATPHVSGAAALVWSRPGVTSNSQVVEILQESADPRGVSETRLDAWTFHGGLNIHDALSYGVVVVPNQPPVAHAGADQTLTDADRTGAESVMLNGAGSSDADGTVVSYQWSEGGTAIASGVTPTVSLPVGEHTLTLTVNDDDGGSSSDTVRITILAAPPAADTVAILKAAYQTSRRQLTMEATSSGAPNATLTVYDNTNPGSPVELGGLQYNARKGRYLATFTLQSAPASVLVVSSGGGSATRAVEIGGKK
jgi:thermitase